MLWVLMGLGAGGGWDTRAQNCTVWVPRTDVGSPGQRAHHAMAYDPVRKVTVFFGGQLGNPGSVAYFNDTQEYDGTNWTQVPITGPSPSPRSFHAMAADGRGGVWLYGGQNGGGAFDDLWEYRHSAGGATWTQDYPTTLFGPGPLAGHAMVATETAQGLRLCVLGGASAILAPDNFQVSTNYWEYNLYVGWQRRPDLALFSGVYGLGAAVDSADGIVIGVGGFQAPNETQLVNPNYGAQVAGAWDVAGFAIFTNVAPGPSPRAEAAVAYDNQRHRLVCVGGAGLQSSVGEEVQEWNRETGFTLGWYSGTPLPRGLGRAGAAMVYDEGRGVMVLTGGAGGNLPKDGSAYADTWELTPPSNPISITMNPSGLCCRSSLVQADATIHTDRPVTWEWFVRAGQASPWKPANVSTISNLWLLPPTSWQFDYAPLYGPGPVLLDDYVTSSGWTEFKLEGTDSCGNVYSGTGVVNIVAPPIMTPRAYLSADVTNPNDDPLYQHYFRCPGDAVEMQLTAGYLGNHPSLGTQWYRNGNPVGAGSLLTGVPTLTLTNLQLQDTGDYYVVLTNVCGASAPSPHLHLQVGVSIQSQPVNTVVNPCQSAQFSVGAAGVGTLVYQWRSEGIPLTNGAHFAGVTTSNLTVHPALYDDERHYDVVIFDDCGPANAVTSTVATLALTTPPWVQVSMLPSTPEVQTPLGAWVSAYDENRGVLVMYGGHNNRGDAGNSMWEYDGQTWKMIQDSYNNLGTISAGQQLFYNGYFYAAPANFAMVYNPDDQQVYLFGEVSWQTPLTVWTWDGQTWRQPYFGPIMGGESYYRAVYDRLHHKVLLTRSHNRSYQTELLVYDPPQKTMTGPTLMQPPVDTGDNAAFWVYDEYRQVSFWYQNDGNGFNPPSMWSYDGLGSWTKLNGSTPPPVFPQYSKFPNVVYDPVRHRSVAFGGGFFGPPDGWYTGTSAFPATNNNNTLPFATDWLLEQPDGPPHNPGAVGISPTNNWVAETMAFDRRRRAFVAPGYLNASPYQTGIPLQWSTYERRYLDAVQIDVPPAAVAALRGSTVQLTVKAAGYGPLAYTWRHNGSTVQHGPAGAAPGGGVVSGGRSAALTITGLSDSDQGGYDVVIANACGVTISRPVLVVYSGATVISGSSLSGHDFSFQFAGFPGLIVTVETAPTMSGPWQKKLA